jgi:hypothetical protein
MLVDNPIDRYKVGSETPRLKTNTDGSISIPIQHAEPTGPEKVNWLPAPEGNFSLVLRFYQPARSFLTEHIRCRSW